MELDAERKAEQMAETDNPLSSVFTELRAECDASEYPAYCNCVVDRWLEVYTEEELFDLGYGMVRSEGDLPQALQELTKDCWHELE